MPHDPRFDETREAQSIFRRLLDAIAWPGKIVQLDAGLSEPPEPWSSALARVARTLLDAQVTFAVIGPNADAFTRYVAVNTGARAADPIECDYLLTNAPFDELDVQLLRGGSPSTPEDGATLIVGCQSVDDAEATSPSTGSLRLWLRGRGVRGERALDVDEPTVRLLGRVLAREDEYPLGLDVFLVAPSGEIVALPRTTRWRAEVPAWVT